MQSAVYVVVPVTGGCTAVVVVVDAVDVVEPAVVDVVEPVEDVVDEPDVVDVDELVVDEPDVVDVVDPVEAVVDEAAVVVVVAAGHTPAAPAIGMHAKPVVSGTNGGPKVGAATVPPWVHDPPMQTSEGVMMPPNRLAVV